MAAATLGWMVGTPVFLTGAPAADCVRVIVSMTWEGIVGVGVGASVMSLHPSSSSGSWDFGLSLGCGVNGISKQVVYGVMIQIRVIDGVPAELSSSRRLMFASSETGSWSSAAVKTSRLEIALSSRTVVTTVTKLVACTAIQATKQDKAMATAHIFGH